MQRQPLGMPCAVREALVPAVRVRYDRHARDINDSSNYNIR